MADRQRAGVFLEAFIGLDPESPKSWSGAMTYLLEAMRNADRLDRVVPLALSGPQRALLMARNFSRDRERWRRQYYFSPGYRGAVTALARKTGYEGGCALQFGALFSLPRALAGQRCLSMHDGNLAERVQSGFARLSLSPKQIDQALRYEEEVAGEMTAICTMSEYLRQSFIRNYRVSPDKVFHVGGAINLRETPPEVTGKDYANQQILFIGVEFMRKGGPQLLEAFAIVRERYPAARLHVVGPRELAEVPPGVVFHGHLAKSDPAQKAVLDGLFQECSLFVMPSLYEPYGIAPLEAMLYGMPCVLTNAWALGEMVTPGVNGALVEKGSGEDLAEKLGWMLADPQRLAAMGHAARAGVIPQYTWPAVVARLGAVMDGV